MCRTPSLYQAIHPAVVNRKVWGGNQIEAGSLAQLRKTSEVTCPLWVYFLMVLPSSDSPVMSWTNGISHKVLSFAALYEKRLNHVIEA